MINYLRHLFLPHDTNNHRPKILHHKALSLIVIGFLALLYLVPSFQSKYPSVLGVSSSITVEELLRLTNEMREEAGVSPLELDHALSNAASRKASYMFEKNFWAHVAPDGTTPWYFIRSAGYEYQYAGENLARGFSTSEDVVEAWMESPTHRANLLSPNYKDIGFAVDAGSLTGSETILVVQAFGSRFEGSQDVAIASADTSIGENSSSPSSGDISEAEAVNSQEGLVAASVNNPLVDTRSTSFNLTIFLFVLFIVVLVIDAVIIKKKNLNRALSHNLDHIIYLGVLLAAVIIISGGLVI
jgi:hypothetical protein